MLYAGLDLCRKRLDFHLLDEVGDTVAWLHNLKRLLVRYERRADMHRAMLALGCCLVCFRRLRSSM